MNIGQLNIEASGLIEIQEGLNIIGIQDINLFSRTVAVIKGVPSENIIYSVDMQPQGWNKVAIMLGDAVSGLEIRDYYSHYVEKTLELSLSEKGLEQLYQLNNQIRTVLDSEIIDHNLPFVISNEWRPDKLIKSQSILLEKPHFLSIFGKILDIIHVMSLMSESKFLVITNLTMYCTSKELEELHSCLLAEGINLIAIDLVGERHISSDKCNVVMIDSDFVVWD